MKKFCVVSRNNDIKVCSFDRKEVYEHLWGTMDLGVVSLSKGFTQLKLRALKIPNGEAIDIKEVHLIRKR